jgi:hypothetical protein
MPQTWEDAKDALNRLYKYPNAVFYMALFSDTTLVTTNFTAATTDIITPASGNLIAGCRVQASSSGTLPPPLAAGTDYYIVGSAGSLKLAANFNGTAIDITGTGSGTHTLAEQVPNKFAPLAVWVRHEVNYQGSGRQLVSWANAAIQEDFTNNRVFLDGQYYVFNPTNNDLAYRWRGLICDGTATRGDATGRMRDVKDSGALLTQPRSSPLEEVFRPSIQLTSS